MGLYRFRGDCVSCRSPQSQPFPGLGSFVLAWQHFRSEETGGRKEGLFQPANLHKRGTEALTRLFGRNAKNCHLGLSGCERGFTNSGRRGVESASISDLGGVAHFCLLRPCEDKKQLSPLPLYRARLIEPSLIPRPRWHFNGNAQSHEAMYEGLESLSLELSTSLGIKNLE